MRAGGREETPFCAGFDLSEFSVDEPGFQERLWRSADRFHRTVLWFPAARSSPPVQGPALAGGFDLAVMCDIRVATTDARFGHPEQRWSDVVFSPLADLVGSGAGATTSVSPVGPSTPPPALRHRAGLRAWSSRRARPEGDPRSPHGGGRATRRARCAPRPRRCGAAGHRPEIAPPWSCERRRLLVGAVAGTPTALSETR